MKRRRVIILGLASLSFLIEWGPNLLADNQPGNRPLNLLLITVDTLRADKLGCYGGRVKTPHIDDLASRAILFQRAFAHNPMTLPSHANILLGTTPLHHGVHDNVNFVIPDENLTLAEHLKRFGYATGAVIGAFPLDARFGLSQGFDFYEDDFKAKGAPKQAPGERTADRVSRICMNWLEERQSPWFLWMHLFDPHFPYQPPEPYRSRYPNKPYDGEVAYIDAVLGDFFAMLKARDMWQGTMIVLTSDHGESLGWHGEKTHGMFAYNATLHVPLIISLPGLRPRAVRQHACHIDIFPTVCDLLEVPIPAEKQGISLRPALLGKKTPDRSIYFESLEPYYNFDWAPLRGYIRGHEKYIDSPIPELYNLRSDFSENTSLASAGISKKYKTRLNGLMQQLSGSLSSEAEFRHDQKTMDKLRSLGYSATRLSDRERTFGPGDDVKTMLPLFNQCIEAYTLEGPGSIEKGIERLTRILETNREIHHGFLFLARLLQNSGRTEEAIQVLDAGHKRHPRNFEILDLYARALITESRFDEAIRLIEEHYMLQMDHDPSAWVSLGRAYIGKHDLHLAISALETAVEIDDRYADAAALLGKAYALLSERTEAEGDYFKSTHYLQKALSLNPLHTEALTTLGEARLRIGASEEGIALLEKAIRLGAKDGKIYFFLGAAHMSRGRWEKALTYFNNFRPAYLPHLSHDERKNLEAYLKLCRARMSPPKGQDKLSVNPSDRSGAGLSPRTDEKSCGAPTR